MADIVVKIGEQSIVATPKDFATGSKGYNGNGKVVLDGKKYQVGINIIEIGSKPAAAAKKK